MNIHVFDTHAHLNSAPELPSYFCLNVATKPDDWVLAIDIHKNHSNILPAVGIHPWFVETDSQNSIHRLEELLQTHKIFALGEIGLDYSSQYKGFKAEQIKLLETQLYLAKEYHLPVSLHCVKAHGDMYALLKKMDFTKKGVLHGLGGSIELVKGYIDLGYKIGVNGVSCRPNARRYQEMLAYFPLDYFVLETDYPNVLLPQSKQAELSDIFDVAKQVSMIKKCSVEDVIQQTTSTAESIFL